jgi:pimeloyl-ACP methyl ester carboxylesterase
VEPSDVTAKARDGAELCAQAFGDPSDPTVLLIQGATAAMDWWEDEFCRRLAAAGRHVVRYDNRDTGQSTAYPPGEPGYTGAEVTDDALAVLDAVGARQAHLVGLSMGGGVAQEVALDHPERVLTITLVATTPVGPRPDGLELPPPSAELAALFAGGGPPDPDWSDREAVVDWLVDGFRPYAGSGPFDEAGLRAVAARVAARSRSLASGPNHFAIDQGPGPSRALVDLDVPALVIHGAEDPLFPLPHGEALARLIPGASLLVLDRTGHEVPRAAWDAVVPAIVAHTA